MKTLDLKKLNVVELNEVQKQTLDGGCLGCNVVDFVAGAVKSWIHGK